MSRKSIISLFFFILIFLFSCTEFGEPPMHPSEWLEPESEYSHMARIHNNIQSFVNEDDTWILALSSCKECHGNPDDRFDFHGGSSGVSCYGCHAGGPSGHPDWSEWMQDTTSVDFHGNRVEERGTAHCMQCHGQDLQGGVSEVSCYVCHSSVPIYSGHPLESIWMDEESDQFHGEVADEEGINYCQQCHGDDLEGGISGVACTTCHSNGFENGD